MQAIVTALDEPWRERVEEIWAELRAVFQLKAIAGSTEPHVTYHVAERYDETRIAPILARIASTTAPFEIDTHGLGVFRGKETVLALHITPSAELLATHRAIWSNVSAALPGEPSAASDVKEAYTAATWAPHVTLATVGLREEQLPDIMALLGRRDYRWRMPATNLCLIPDTSSKTAAWTRWGLRR